MDATPPQPSPQVGENRPGSALCPPTLPLQHPPQVQLADFKWGLLCGLKNVSVDVTIVAGTCASRVRTTRNDGGLATLFDSALSRKFEKYQSTLA